MISQPTIETRPNRQYLTLKASTSEGLFHDLICFQAQIEAAARQSVALRLAGSPKALIRTWSIRGTLQMGLEEDTRSLVLITRDRNIGEALRILANHGLEETEAWDVAAIACSALEGAGEVPRDALYDPIARVVGKSKAGVALSPWGGVLKLVATQYLLDVKNVDTRGTTCRLGERLEEVSVQEAVDSYIGPLWHRFLSGYGPAMPKDFRAWLGVSAKTISGQGIMVPDDTAGADNSTGPQALVLPAFDPYIISSAARDSLFISSKVKEGVIRRGGWLASCVLTDYTIVGYRTPGNQGRYVIDERYLNRVRRELPDLTTLKGLMQG